MSKMCALYFCSKSSKWLKILKFASQAYTVVHLKIVVVVVNHVFQLKEETNESSKWQWLIDSRVSQFYLHKKYMFYHTNVGLE
jgi:hypothetical protein